MDLDPFFALLLIDVDHVVVGAHRNLCMEENTVRHRFTLKGYFEGYYKPRMSVTGIKVHVPLRGLNVVRRFSLLQHRIVLCYLQAGPSCRVQNKYCSSTSVINNNKKIAAAAAAS